MVSDKSCREIRTHSLRTITFFPENRALLRNNVEKEAEPGRSEVTIEYGASEWHAG